LTNEVDRSWRDVPLEKRIKLWAETVAAHDEKADIYTNELLDSIGILLHTGNSLSREYYADIDRPLCLELEETCNKVLIMQRNAVAYFMSR